LTYDERKKAIDAVLWEMAFLGEEKTKLNERLTLIEKRLDNLRDAADALYKEKPE
jgi:hypothetical protein